MTGQELHALYMLGMGFEYPWAKVGKQEQAAFIVLAEALNRVIRDGAISAMVGERLEERRLIVSFLREKANQFIADDAKIEKPDTIGPMIDGLKLMAAVARDFSNMLENGDHTPAKQKGHSDGTGSKTEATGG